MLHQIYDAYKYRPLGTGDYTRKLGKRFPAKIFKQVSDRPALPPRLVLAITSHDSLVRFFWENPKTDHWSKIT